MLIADIDIKIPLSILLPQDFYSGWNSDHTNKVKRNLFIFFKSENLRCSTFSANVTKRSDCFQRLLSCYHAAAPDWNKWPQGDSEGMRLTHLRNSLLTSDMFFILYLLPGRTAWSIKSLHLQLMGWELPAPQRFTLLSCGQDSRTPAPPETSESGGVLLNFTSALWGTSNSEITESQLASISHSQLSVREKTPSRQSLGQCMGILWHLTFLSIAWTKTQ